MVENGNYESWPRCAHGDSWNLYLLDHHYYFTPHSLERIARRAGYSSFQLSNSGKMHPSMRLIYKRPLHYLTSLLEYWRAPRRWPKHGNICVMVAFLRK